MGVSGSACVRVGKGQDGLWPKGRKVSHVKRDRGSEGA